MQLRILVRTHVVGAFPAGQSCLNLAATRPRHIAGTMLHKYATAISATTFRLTKVQKCLDIHFGEDPSIGRGDHATPTVVHTDQAVIDVLTDTGSLCKSAHRNTHESG